MGEENETDFISWGGLLGATITVLITTLDDSIWLLPFVGTSSLSMEARIINSVTFLSTLVGLAVVCCLVAVAIQSTVSTQTKLESEELEIKLEIIAVIFCWVLAIGFYVKKQLKKRRRQREHEAAALANNSNKESVEQGSYGALSQEDAEETEDDGPKSSQPCTILSLTTLGFLDEISYFPALVIGNIFTVWELCIGTLLAGLIMLGIQWFVARQFKPVIDFLDDHVKLYHVIGIFATILTIQLVRDVTHLDDDE